MDKTFPTQPIVNDSFVENRIVSMLLAKCEENGLTLTEINMMDFTREERIQFAQLLGATLEGFGMLSYVDDESYGTVRRINKGMTELEARNSTLRDQLKEAREGVRLAATALFMIAPEDLTH